MKYSGQAAIKGDIEHFKTALAKVTGVQGFMPVVAPGSVAPERKDEYYKSEEEGLFAIDCFGCERESAFALYEGTQTCAKNRMIICHYDADFLLRRGTGYGGKSARVCRVLRHTLRATWLSL